MTNTESQKVMMTVSVDLGTRHLIHKHGGSRGVGRLLAELIRKHDTEEVVGPKMISSRLDRIEQRLIKLLDEKGVEIKKQVPQ